MTPDQLLALADQCVKCGLCLPHCPTYGALRNEADSPRGRIALIQGWAQGRLDPTPTWAAHLDGCLGCRACEGVCPSLVAYGRLADGAKAARTRASPHWRRIARRTWLATLSDARATRWLSRAAGLYRRLGVARLAERVGLARLAPLAPYHRLALAIPRPTQSLPASAPVEADLELFVGCMGELAQGRALAAALGLCEALGLAARVSGQAQCCGAMLRHNGFPDEAERRRLRCAPRPEPPVQVDASRGPVPLVGVSSACVAELREGAGKGQGAQGSALPIDAWELCDFLMRRAPLGRLSLRPLGLSVLVHEPCSHRHLLGGNTAVHRLLGLIPGLRVRALPGGSACCGAAGTYLLEHPEMAARLLAPKLDPLVQEPPDLLVTTNPGCALHLAAGLAELALETRVVHPVELLWQSARDPGAA